jgi:dTDP-4-dehydrorhamnose reductase
MKILITGASGYLGRRLAPLAASRHDVVSGFSRHPGGVTAGTPLHLDFQRPQAVEAAIRQLAPDAVVHTAAINPGGGDDAMLRVNAEGSVAVTRAAVALGARLVHVSTDVVHDGTRGPYGDDDKPSPWALYPHTKVAAEAGIRDLMPTAAIVRTSLIYALDEIDRGTEGFAARLRSGESLRLFSDVLRQPVWAPTLAEALLRLAENEYAGFLNVAGSEVLSREAYGRRMLAFWGHIEDQNDPRITAVTVRELGLNVPRDLRLDLDRARQVLGMDLPGVGAVLARASHPRPTRSP